MLFEFGEKLRASSEESNFAIESFLSYPGVTEGFEQLNQIQSERIYDKALKIYARYFDVEVNNKMECD
jgi:hypothetical protein